MGRNRERERQSLRTCLILASVANHYDSDGLSNLYATVESRSNSEKFSKFETSVNVRLRSFLLDSIPSVWDSFVPTLEHRWFCTFNIFMTLITVVYLEFNFIPLFWQIWNFTSHLQVNCIVTINVALSHNLSCLPNFVWQSFFFYMMLYTLSSFIFYALDIERVICQMCNIHGERVEM